MALSLPPLLVRQVARGTIGLPGILHAPVGFERRWIRAVASTIRTPKGTEAEPIELGGVPGERVTGPWAKPGRTLLYVHGGGYVAHSARTYRGLIAALSKAAASTVVAPDYPLAPEHPFPAGPDGVHAAYTALRAETDGVITLAGDSAGGGLALGLLLRLRHGGERLPAGAVLFCPWVDLSHSGPSFETAGWGEPVLRAGRSVRNAGLYADGEDLRDARLSPLFATDFTGLPPIHLQGASDDLLASDADALAERLREAGADFEYRRFDGMWHDFQALGELMATARAAMAAAGSALDGYASTSVVAGGAVEAAAQG